MFEIGTIEVVRIDGSLAISGITTGSIFIGFDKMIDGISRPAIFGQFKGVINEQIAPIDVLTKIGFLTPAIVEVINIIVENHLDDGSISIAIITANRGWAITRSEPGNRLKFPGEIGYRDRDGNYLKGDPSATMNDHAEIIKG